MQAPLPLWCYKPKTCFDLFCVVALPSASAVPLFVLAKAQICYSVYTVLRADDSETAPTTLVLPY